MKKYTVQTGYATDWNNLYNCYDCHYSHENGICFDDYNEAKELFNKLVAEAKGNPAEIVEIIDNEELEKNDGCCGTEIVEIFETDPYGNEIK